MKRTRKCQRHDGSFVKWIPWIVVVTAVTPFICSAQSFEWSVSPMVFLDSEFTDGPEVGPGISLGAALSPGGSFAYGLFLTLARTDFPVASDDFHRNFASAGVGLRLMTGGDGATIGIALGAGVFVEDDVNETERRKEETCVSSSTVICPKWTSSANGEEIVMLGVEAQFPVTASWGVTIFARDQVGGWWLGLLASDDEYSLTHRFLLGAGVYFR